ncbi:30S ribosomal subunit protein S2 [Candidatus Vidania fulgoroideae]|uniref:30S ribosomal subunit protein S2 n=1 Tax=Candidatus Vidania fulgoroideorum TaxID=881286 RepID=A0A346E0J5_9PROT|nr:30S ribosomal subunit protein S2 [Candidatus Vidania fulgoroideae]
MIRYIKLFKKNLIDTGIKSKNINFINKNLISNKKKNKYFININKIMFNIIKSSKALFKYYKKNKNILIIFDSKFVKKKIKNIFNFKNVKFSENINCGNFTNFEILIKENKKHKILKKILFNSNKKNLSIYKKVRNNIKNKPIDIFEYPKIILDLRIKNKKHSFYKECKKLNIKIISFLCLKNNNKYINIPIYIDKSFKCINLILEIIKKNFLNYEKIYQNKKNK